MIKYLKLKFNEWVVALELPLHIFNPKSEFNIEICKTFFLLSVQDKYSNASGEYFK